MAGERTLPGLGLTGFWTLGSPWKSGMDENLRRLSVFAQLIVESRVAALPGSPTDGYIAIVPSGGNAKKVAVRDAGGWVYLDPFEGLRGFVKDTNELVMYDGTNWVPEPDMGIPEPPDDALYGRRGPDGETPGYWDEVVEEAPNDGGTYSRSAGGWVPAPTGGGGGGDFPEAPTDGKTYGRKNSAWAEIVGGGGGGGGAEGYTKYSKYRVTSNVSANGFDTCFGEIKFFDREGVKQTPVSANSSTAYGPDYSAAKTIDNNPNTFFHGASGYPQWVELVFAEPFAAKSCKVTVGNGRYGQRSLDYEIRAGDGGLTLLLDRDAPTYVGSSDGAYTLDEFDTPTTIIEYVEEAPEDGKNYQRKDGAWVEAQSKPRQKATHWRLNITAVQGGGGLASGHELRFFLGATAVIPTAITSNRNFGDDSPASNLMIGDAGAYWRGETPAYVTAVFAEPVAFDKLRWHCRGGWPEQSPNAAALEFSTNGGVTWQVALASTSWPTMPDNSYVDVVTDVYGDASSAPYDIAVSYPGVVPASAVVRHLAVRPYVLPAGLALSRGFVATDSGDGVELSIRKNGVQFGTATTDGGGNFVLAAAASASFVAGDVLEVAVPGDPGGIEDLVLTFAGYR